MPPNYFASTARRIWPFVLAVAAIVGIAGGVKTLFFDNNDIFSGNQHPVQAGEVREAGTLEEMRTKNNVRPLRPTEESAELSTLPKGVYGFVSSGMTGHRIHTEKINALKLRKSKSNTYSVELHKTLEGEVLIVLFITAGDLRRITDPGREQVADMFVLFSAKNEYKVLVALPASRVLHWSDRVGEELGSFARIEVR